MGSKETIKFENIIPPHERGAYQICNLRIYSRELSRKECRRDYKIDERRF